MTWPTTIATPRLTLRPFDQGDSEAMLAMMTSADVHRYMGGAASHEVALAWLVQQSTGAPWGSFAVTLTSTGEAVGSLSFDLDRDDLEISWLLLPQHWGNGYATEAADAAIAWGFATTDAPRIIAVTQTANAASRRLAERLGMRRVEVFEEFDAQQAKYEVDRA